MCFPLLIQVYGDAVAGSTCLQMWLYDIRFLPTSMYAYLGLGLSSVPGLGWFFVKYCVNMSATYKVKWSHIDKCTCRRNSFRSSA